MSPEYVEFYLRRSKTLAFLDQLQETANDGAVSVYLPPGLSAPEIGVLISRAGAQSAGDEIVRLAVASANGAVLFWGGERRCLVLPPFPLREKGLFPGYAAEPLRQLIGNDFTVGLVLVHLGSYAVGVCRGEALITSKVGTGLVHGRHKKGGSSQGRFQRRRQNQASEFLDRVCIHAVEKLEPHIKNLDYIAYGGPHHTVLQLQKRCPFLAALADRVLPLMEVPALRQRVLETAVGRLWSSVVIEWGEE